MKVAVSIPDPVFAKAEALAKQMQLSRSKVYARALGEYVERHSDSELTRAANLLADMVDEDDELWLKAGARIALHDTKWQTD